MEDGSYPIIIAVLCIVIVILMVVIILNYLFYRKRSNSIITSLNSANRDFTEEDIITLVKEGHEQGVIEESEAKMIHNIFKFDDKEVKDIMTHRKNMICIDGELSYNDALAYAVESGKSRFPIYEGDLDHIIGVLHIKDMLAYAQKNEVFRTSIKDINNLVREVDFVPETLGINVLFKNMQRNKNHVTMVVDEYGQIAGLVAMEDILEEIVGNIEDEHDTEHELITPESDGTYIMEGITNFADVLEVIDIPVEEDSFETLNGLVVSLLGHIPNDDEKAKVEAYGYTFEILSVTDNMIDNVRISKCENLHQK